MKYSSKILFMTIILSSTTLVLMSNTWLSMWMGLEMNLMAFIPFMSETKNFYSSEGCMIYFLTQALGSSLFLMAIMFNSSYMLMYMESSFIMMVSMLIKMGAAPFHLWLPIMVEKLNWTKCLMLLTWQKIAPLHIISNMSLNYNSMSLFIMMSAIIGSVGGLNQSSLRKIMAYSSINHLGWMLSCILMENNMWMIYLLIYSTTVMLMMILFKKMSTYMISQITSNSSLTMKINMTMLFMSLGGLPPFLGFMPKWMVIQYLMKLNLHLMTMVMIMSSLLTLFFYLRIITPMMLNNSIKNKWDITLNMSMIMTNSMMIITNLMMPVMYILNI
uniref:NADH-ubiquinone oxidoreductase chain 2 n=1 Tax=Alloeorhynchus sp. TaxID=2931281 RepID=A0A8T9ZXM6_9HEMI|nr:NADH dehydrogenase subunit 2 [Alloeorhynchus sp.]